MTRHVLVCSLAAVLALPPFVRAQPPRCENDPCSREELEVHERRVARHLLRVQQARFEQHARSEVNGTIEEDAAKLTRLERQFKRTQGRWIEARGALAAVSNPE